MTYTVEQVTEAIESVVSGHEDYIYQAPEGVAASQCVYTTKDAQPSCIVGQVAAILDPSIVTELHAYEWAEERPASFGAECLFTDKTANRYGPNGWSEEALTPTLDRDTDPTIVAALMLAQEIQDGFAPWKYSLQAYHLVIAGTPEDEARETVNEAIHAERIAVNPW